ncbi:methylaspartate mutase [Nocardia sp. NPDC051570]|uniref:methylaspartate mutase n=1 Tax=Nocardia sp. NPDC051570 TaxID=3364324 RepID=UPI0037978F6B
MSIVTSADNGFGAFVARAHRAGKLVVQPRMGISAPEQMRAGLRATCDADGATVGTLTVDSYTRVGDLEAAQLAVLDGVALNGYPIVSHQHSTTAEVLDSIAGPEFPVQVRHGSANPRDIFRAMTAVGLDASEGGPASYCLPYGRVPLSESTRHWIRSCDELVELRATGLEPHLESFGGCMLGQLCPPSELVAISALEAMFFHYHGFRSISASYAQQTNPIQDAEAVRALQRLCADHLPETDWHIVIYAYMGVYPSTRSGAYALLGTAARLAASTGCARLIVKTEAESVRIPTVAENVAALEYAAAVADATPRSVAEPGDSQTYREAAALVAAVMNLDADPGMAMLRAFERGYLDIPYCLHPDNRSLSRSYIDDRGYLCWADIGRLPLSGMVDSSGPRTLSSSGLIESLTYVSRKFDQELGPVDTTPMPAVRGG